MLLDLGGEPVESFDAILEVFKNRKPLIVMKRTKSGTRETDIMPMINAIEPTTLEKGELARIKITTAAGNVTNLRPELAVNALAEKANVPVRILGIHRLSLIWEFEA